MQDKLEIYKALLNGETLIHENGGTAFLLNGKVNKDYHFSWPSAWRIKNKFEDLRKAHSEGALIECRPSDGEWQKSEHPAWLLGDYEYRIRDGITIEQWNKHKDSIKAYWDGENIELLFAEREWYNIKNITWEVNSNFRVKDAKVELREAFRQGAIIECNIDGKWQKTQNPTWVLSDFEYRIKDGISIVQWNKHKDSIKAYWDGENIRLVEKRDKSVSYLDESPTWQVNNEYIVEDDEEVKLYCKLKAIQGSELIVTENYFEVDSFDYNMLLDQGYEPMEMLSYEEVI